jgi:Putative beta barrel porin-7 (BBP7)
MVLRRPLSGALALAITLLSGGQLFAQSFNGPLAPPPPLTHEGYSPPPPAQPPGEPSTNPYTDEPSGPPPFGPPTSGPPSSGPPGYPPPLTGPPPGSMASPVYGPPPGYGPLPAYSPPPLVFFPAFSPDPPRFWLRSDYLVWWTKGAPLPPLVTTGSTNDSVPGALGQPGTSVIYGGNSVDLGATSGWRLDIGGYFDAHETWGLQSVLILLGRQEADFNAYSDQNGNPLIARPVTLAGGGGESAYADSFPGALAGGVSVTNTSEFLSYELNGLGKIFQNDRWRVEGLAGFRYMNLTESLELDDVVLPLTSGALTFLGQPVDTSSTLFDFDRFKTTNNFFGGQAGARVTWTTGPVSIESVTKLGLGATVERTEISGATTVVNGAGVASSAPGGILATTANIGGYSQTRFSLVPEEDLNFNLALTPYISARIGYTFMYWTNVVRPGDQVTRVASPTLVPSDPTYGTGGPNEPGNHFQTAGYWAQGLNIGLDFHF